MISASRWVKCVREVITLDVGVRCEDISNSNVSQLQHTLFTYLLSTKDNEQYMRRRNIVIRGLQVPNDYNGCRRTGSDWTQTRHSSSGSEQATSWTFFRPIPYPQMNLSTTWESTLILNYSWSARWTSSAKSATFICDVWERFAGR